MTAFDEPPPDTDEHHVCTQEEWAAFINKEEQKLLDAGTESVYGTSEIETVVRSDMDGIEGRSLNTMVSTVAANDITEDSVDLRKIYNFEHNEFSYKLPIIDMKERILSTVNGNQIVIISGPTGWRVYKYAGLSNSKQIFALCSGDSNSKAIFTL